MSAAPAPQVAINRRSAPQRCAICHAPESDLPLRCAGCGTEVHAECLSGSRCPTQGCAGRPRPQARAGSPFTGGIDRGRGAEGLRLEDLTLLVLVGSGAVTPFALLALLTHLL